MAIVIVNLETRYLPDGSLHMSSPDVPGFHVVDHERKRSQTQFFVEKALPLLEQTIGRRAAEAKIGERATVHWKNILDVKSVVPAELARRAKVADVVPRQLIAEIT
jgi:hypothetical protein